METNWFEEGQHAAERHDGRILMLPENAMEPAEPECPWPIHTPEGRAWFRGWNFAAWDYCAQIDVRFPGGRCFHPDFA